MFFAFIISFDEVIVAVFLSGTSAPTLPKQLLNATRFEFRPTIAAVSVLLVLGTVVIMTCVGLMQRLLSRSRPATGSTG
jgi:ABC-type spermidine/putrescine transport system permease subunit II